MEATKLGLSPVPGMPSQAPSTSVKQRGREGLRVDVLTHGKEMGKTVPVAALKWHAQTVPHYAYLLDEPRAMHALMKTRLPMLRRALSDHPQTLEQFELALR